MNNNTFNENFEYMEEDSYPNFDHNLVNNFNYFSSSNTADLIQNETQYSNLLYFKSGETQSSLKNNNKGKDDFTKPKEKVIFKIEHNADKKILTQNKKRKIQETADKIETIHTKYADDNIIRKCKFIVLSHIMDFINVKIKEKYKNIGYGTKIKQLMKLNKSQVSNIKTDYNLKFMNKELKDIFSDTISTKYTKYPLKKNENLINELLNEKDKEKKEYFNNLFSLTFSDCLNHFIDKKFIPILKDLELFKKIINDSKKLKKINLNIKDQEYISELSYYLENYEKILLRKKPRRAKKNFSVRIVINENY